MKCEDIATLPGRRQYGSEFGEAVGTGGGAAFGSKLEFTRERDFFVSILLWKCCDDIIGTPPTTA